jgi:hypothetical protein
MAHSDRLVAVNEDWVCPISYDWRRLTPVYAARFMISDAPTTFVQQPCGCGFGQWVSACRCYTDGAWRAGGGTFTAFRFIDSPAGAVDVVAVSVHLTTRDPEIRAKGAEEVLVPLIRLLRAKWNAPVVLGGDFNMTKVQSAHKTDKRHGGGAGFVHGAYGHLVGCHAHHRAQLEGAARSVPPDNTSSENEEDEDTLAAVQARPQTLNRRATTLLCCVAAACGHQPHLLTHAACARLVHCRHRLVPTRGSWRVPCARVRRTQMTAWRPLVTTGTASTGRTKSCRCARRGQGPTPSICLAPMASTATQRRI